DHEPVADHAVGRGAHGQVLDRFVVSDVFETRERLRRAAERARHEEQPALIELLTYRFRGHSMSDPAKYRTKDEVEIWRERDPLHRAEVELRDDHGWSEEQLEELDASVVEEMDRAIAVAEESRLPAPGHRSRHHRG